MKQFVFNLEPLLRLRGSEAESASGWLGEAVRERLRREQVYEAWEHRLNELDEAQQRARSEHPSAAAVSRLNLLVRETLSQLAEARSAVSKSQEDEEKARVAWQEARRREEVIEKLRERRLAEHRQRMLRLAEQEALDLFMTRAARHRNGNRAVAEASTPSSS